ncbi:MAG: hypothetical protein HWE27_13990 [Gammaproteobacteria bacterium]|nr:hypothetical protein [Gammaproteobacteria bacterium]
MNFTRSLLASSPESLAEQDRARNLINGSDAESYAMAKFLLACRGEGCWGSREEDNSKIDLIFSFEHPWSKGERSLVLTQVKSGASYGRVSDHGFELKARAKKLAIRTSHSICVVWVDRDSNKLFWAYIHPEVSVRNQQYGVHHEVSPATVFDLARCMSRVNAGTRGAKGLIIRARSSGVTDRRKKVKKAYKSFSTINSPVLGTIYLTRLAWRHMFRSGRREENKASSLNIIPYLNRLLIRSPSDHAITESRRFSSRGFSYQIREHLLKFEGLALSTKDNENEKDLVAYVRLIEEIKYPNNWEEKAMLSQQIERRVVLKSAYYKKKR